MPVLERRLVIESKDETIEAFEAVEKRIRDQAADLSAWGFDVSAKIALADAVAELAKIPVMKTRSVGPTGMLFSDAVEAQGLQHEIDRLAERNRDLLAMTGEDAMAFVQATIEVRANSGLLAIIEDAKRAAASAPYAPIRGADTLGIPGSAGYEINRLNATLAAATKCFQAEMVRVLMRNRDLDDENARLAKKCDGLDAENRTLRAQLVVHRAGSVVTRKLSATAALLASLESELVKNLLANGSASDEAKEFAKSIASASLIAESETNPEDPRSAALARALAGDRLPDGYAR